MRFIAGKAYSSHDVFLGMVYITLSVVFIICVGLCWLYSCFAEYRSSHSNRCDGNA